MVRKKGNQASVFANVCVNGPGPVEEAVVKEFYTSFYAMA